MQTTLCRRLGITLPIIQAPMAGGWTTPQLVAAVSEAGGLGMLAGARLSAAQLREQIGEIRRRTQRPFGVNFLIPQVEPSVDQNDAAPAIGVLQSIRRQLSLPAEPGSRGTEEVSAAEGVEIALEARVPVLSFAFGSPAAYVAAARATDCVIMATATTVAEAEAVQADGVDMVVAQGSEAGGHRSTFEPGPPESLPLIGTMALVPAVVDAVTIPVVAAGGIMDGRGTVAALALGAQAAQLGTRFLLASESGTPPGYRRQLLRAVETETVVTDVFTGRPGRALRNAFVRAFREASVRPLPWPRQAEAAIDIYRSSFVGDGEWAPLFAGQGVRLARREQPAGEIVRELADEARRVVERLPGRAG